MVNKVVDRINEFNAKFVRRFTKSIVTVKKTKGKRTNKATLQVEMFETLYIVVPTTEQETKDIITKQLLSEEIIQQLLNQSLIKNKKDINSCAFCGNLKLFTSYDELVAKYPMRLVDIRERKEPEYRLYTRTKEEQDKMRGIFNICNSSRKSWFSVIEKCGSEFGVILKLIVPIN